LRRRSYDVVVSEWAWDPDTYLAEMAAEVPGYEELQEAVVAATGGVRATRVLELGTGTGETALRARALHPEAGWVGIDASEPMLARARERLPDADLRLQRLEDELPSGPFDLVVAVLAVHHLDAAGKRELFSRVARVLGPGGHFVLGDVVVPAAGEEGPIEIDWEMDKPDSVEDQLAWLGEAGFEAEASSVRVDLAVFRCRLSGR
jgi:tRNA (cmo5U34)-methyltransferase